jgi:hypothetical protein
MEELTNADYLNSELQDIFLHKLEVLVGTAQAYVTMLVGTAQAYVTNESPIAGRKLADLLKTLEEATEEAGADRLMTILPLLVELVADSLVELIADNNRRLLELMAKD